MKARACLLAALVAAPGAAIAAATTTEVTPEQLLSAVDQMTPDQAYTLYETLEAKLWQPLPQGFFSRMSFLVDVYAASLDDPGVPALDLSAGDLDLDEAGGTSARILWQLFHPRFRLGLAVDAWQAEDSDLRSAGYSRAELTGGSVALVANHQFVREPSWLLWGELAAGAAGAELEVVDTPAGQPTTMHEFDAGYPYLDLGAGIGWRFNPVLGLFATGAWRLADDAEWEEGSRETNLTLDATGYRFGVGLSINF